MNMGKINNKKILLVIVLFLYSLALSSCLNGNNYGREEPPLPKALEPGGDIRGSDTLRTLNLETLRKHAPLKKEKEKVVLEGEVVCLPCELKEELQANSQCEKYGHQNVLRTNDGSIYSFIENDKTTDLIRKSEHKNKTIRVIGTLYKEVNIIDVISFEVIEK